MARDSVMIFAAEGWSQFSRFLKRAAQVTLTRITQPLASFWSLSNQNVGINLRRTNFPKAADLPKQRHSLYRLRSDK